MSLRTIMVFPQFDNMGIIDRIRSQYDPLSELVKPHITLVFPFESQISNADLARILDRCLQGIKPFELKLGGIAKQEDALGNYLFLRVMQGAEELTYIHHSLYSTDDLKEFDIGLQYIPHMTLGKFDSVELLYNAFSNTQSVEDIFCTTVEKVSVEMIGENEESIIVMEKGLI